MWAQLVSSCKHMYAAGLSRCVMHIPCIAPSIADLQPDTSCSCGCYTNGGCSTSRSQPKYIPEQTRQEKTPPYLVERGVQPASADGLDDSDCFQAPGSAQAVPDQALGAVDLDALHVCEHLLDRLHLRHVAHQRARRMRVDVVHLYNMVCLS